MTKYLLNGRSLINIVGVCLTITLIAAAEALAQGSNIGDDPIQVGRKDAPIKLEVFYDMQCPSCANFHPILKAAIAKYQDQLLVTFRHFPISFHDKAFLAGMAVEAAKQQKKGFEMLDMLLLNQAEWAWSPKFRAKIDAYAKKLGLDLRKFRADLNGSQAEGRMIKDMERGKQLKVGAAPTVFLNGRILAYPDAMNLDEVISNALNK